jgi:SNF2 family DNA or RNA helicase
VLDEAHRLRGRDSKRSATLASIAPLCSYKIAITATPSYNRPKDLWQLLDIVLPGYFGSRWDFDKRYCGAYPGKWGGLEYPKSGSFNAEELKMRLAHYMIRREKYEVASELPPMTFQVRWVDATSEARKVFAQAQLNIGKKTLHDAVVATLKGKVEEAITLAQESRRFLLATWQKTDARAIHHILNADKDTPCALITGDMPTAKRADTIREARARGQGIVATTDSIAESLNLQGVASVGILHALDWTPLKLAQLFARLHRLGQVDPVIWYLVAMRDTVDQVIIDTQVAKLDQYRGIFGTKSHRGMRHALADEVALEKAERKALAELYEAMK